MKLEAFLDLPILYVVTLKILLLYQDLCQRRLSVLKKSCTELKKFKNQPVTLNQEPQRVFVKLKLTLTSPPLLAYFKQDALTTVDTGASYEGIGVCLSNS